MKCRVCGAGELALYYTQGNNDEFRFYRCPVCRLVNYDLEGGMDQEKYAGRYKDPLNESLATNRAQTLTYRTIRKHIPVSGRFLDIGCGNGRLLHCAREDGWEVHGLELSPFLADSVKERLGIDVEVSDFLQYDVSRSDRNDVVVLRHVLEHLPDSAAAMQAIGALLKDSGYGVLEFPNIDALDMRYKRWAHRTGLHRRKYRKGYRPGHCNEFCRESFEFLLERTGFRLVAWETYSSKPLSNWLFNHWHVGSKARAVIRKVQPAAHFEDVKGDH